MNRLRKLREKKGLSQRDFINKFNSFLEENLNKYDGQPGIKKVTFATGSRWENGLNKPTSAMWQALADYFGVNVLYLQGTTFAKCHWCDNKFVLATEKDTLDDAIGFLNELISTSEGLTNTGKSELTKVARVLYNIYYDDTHAYWKSK